VNRIFIFITCVFMMACVSGIVASTAAAQQAHSYATAKDADLMLPAVRGDGAALAELISRGEHGDREAADILGNYYGGGIPGKPNDYTKAVFWFRKATDNMDDTVQGAASNAAMGLGWCYETGNGVPQDFNQAIAWYRKGGMEGDYQLKQLFAKYPNLNTTTPAMGASGGTPRAGQQEIAEKIADLQSDIEEHESAAEHWDNSIQQISGSGCSGMASALCQSIGQVGLAKAQASRNQELNAAAADRAEISRLQGQIAAPAQTLDTSFSGNLAATSNPDPNSILNAGNNQAAAIRAIGDANAARQTQMARVSSTPQPGPAPPNNQASYTVAGPVRVSAGGQLSANNPSTSSMGSGAIQYTTPLASSCVRQFFDPNTNNWLSFENDCGQPIYVSYIPRHPGGWAMGGGMHLAPGNFNNTGLSSGDLNNAGGMGIYVCPTNSVPVDLNGNTLSTNVADYRCKPQ
jgi:hypothetical protein